MARYNLYKCLKPFDSFFCGRSRDEAISVGVVDDYCSHIAHLSHGTRHNRLSALRNFCRYNVFFDARTYANWTLSLPKRLRHKPHIFTKQEVSAIMRELLRHPRRDPVRSLIWATVTGLLFCTGLRVGEALALRDSDVDLRNCSIIVRSGKFGKRRLITLSRSAATALRRYFSERRKHHPTTPEGPFFPVCVTATSRFSTAFISTLRQLGLRRPHPARGPRVHDLRHSFAVHTLMTWHRKGKNMYVILPRLATYLGHSSLTGTDVYLHSTAELLESSSKRFHNQFHVPTSL